MWDFTPFGLMMPAAVPMDKADAKFTEGKYDLQVRGRVDSHLLYMMEHYMEPGSFHDEIEYTPGMDYNVRFYTTREAYADAMRLIILDIDYKKFKPTAERKDAAGVALYKGGADYHSVLNAIWGSVTRLGAAGGVWGTYNKNTNPAGRRPYGGGRGTLKGFKNSLKRNSDRLWGSDGSAYYGDDSIYGTRSSVTGRTYAESLALDDYDLDWTPNSEDERLALLDEMDGIPADQWEDYLTKEEFDLIQSEYEEIMSRGQSDKLRSRRATKRKSRRSKYGARTPRR